MTPDTDLEVPTAPSGLHNEPALIVGVIIAGLTGLLAVLGAGGFDDGFQWTPDGVAILSPILAALGIRQLTFSQATADLMASRHVQRKAVEQRKRHGG